MDTSAYSKIRTLSWSDGPDINIDWLGVEGSAQIRLAFDQFTSDRNFSNIIDVPPTKLLIYASSSTTTRTTKIEAYVFGVQYTS